MVAIKERRTQAARIAARARWGDQRILRLDQLDPLERRLVEAILEAKRNAEREVAGKLDAR